MARPKKDAEIDLAKSHDLTLNLIDRITCPVGKLQAFLRDADTKGLSVRVTAKGAKSFVFEKKLNRQTIRRTIGDVTNWSIDKARVEARRLAVLLDAGDDPRELDRQREAALESRRKTEAARAEAEIAAAITVGTVWTDYLEKRRPFWGDLHYRDHIDKSKPGGQLSERRGAKNQLTQPGPLASLMALRLKDLDNTVIEAWATKEGQLRPASARLGMVCKSQPSDGLI